jgi:hypothetical protein
LKYCTAKPHTNIANKEDDLTLGTSAPDPNHRRIVGIRRQDRVDRSSLPLTRQETAAGQGPQKAMFSIKTGEDRPSGTFARGAAGIG